MNSFELRAYAEMARREQCRRSLAAFAKQAWHVLEPATELKWGWALDAICEHLEAVTDGKIRRLLMNVPPGSMKSLLTGVIWPAWEWGPRGMPDKRFLGTAHKQELAIRDSMKCRRLIQSEWYQRNWPVAIVGDQNAKGKFENAETGFREAMAFTSLTGSRGDRVILDDPHSVDDANSPTMLAAGVKTFREALPSRVNNEDSAIVIVMQRLNEADVSGVALTLGYEHLCIPMRYDADRKFNSTIGWHDPRTVDGELMFPERFPESQVVELEKSMGSYAAAGQLQQRPSPREGGMFKRQWFGVVDAAPAGLTEYRAWDLAASVAKGTSDPDWSVGVKTGKTVDGFLYILDVVRFRGTSADVERTILNTAQQDGKATAIHLPEDPGAGGKAWAASLVRLLGGFNVRKERPTGAKEVRAQPFAAQAEAGNVLVVKGAWNDAFFDEIEVFPFGKHDDQVDAAADSINALYDGVNSSGFLSMIRQDNRSRVEKQEVAKTTEQAVSDNCPFPKGSLEYLKFHGLV